MRKYPWSWTVGRTRPHHSSLNTSWSGEATSPLSGRRAPCAASACWSRVGFTIEGLAAGGGGVIGTGPMRAGRSLGAGAGGALAAGGAGVAGGGMFTGGAGWFAGAALGAAGPVASCARASAGVASGAASARAARKCERQSRGIGPAFYHFLARA